VADDQAEIIRLLKALNGKEPPEISRRSDDNDAANWVARALRWGADLGLSPEVSTLILSETLHEIRAASSPPSNARARKRGRTMGGLRAAADIRANHRAVGRVSLSRPRLGS
jgi:hypothetical protein